MFLRYTGVTDFPHSINYDSCLPNDCVGKLHTTNGFSETNRLFRLIFTTRKLKQIQLDPTIILDRSYWPLIYHQFQFDWELKIDFNEKSVERLC